MPGLDGLDIAKKVQESKIKTKIILLTMHKEKTIFKKANEYGIYGLVQSDYNWIHPFRKIGYTRGYNFGFH
jgi:DNA-binding NarL/FixJ family response regulator